MTATTTLVACRCSHPKVHHDQDGFAPQCTAIGCTCLRYQPPVDPTTCRCGHDERRHDDETGCAAVECGCAGFRRTVGVTVPTPRAAGTLPPRPVAPPVAPIRTPPVAREPTVTAIPNQPVVLPADDARVLIAAGKRSQSKRITALAVKIDELLTDLRGRLADERLAAERKRADEAQHEQMRREIADLEAKLAAARAKLRGDRPPPSPKSPPKLAPSGDHDCPDCPRTGFGTLQSLGMHRWRAHGIRKAGVSSA